MKIIAVCSLLASLLITATAVHLSLPESADIAAPLPEMARPMTARVQIAAAGSDLVLITSSPDVIIGIRGAEALPTPGEAAFETIADAVAY